MQTQHRQQAKTLAPGQSGAEASGGDIEVRRIQGYRPF
jgi:hypothetical protein